MGLVLGLYLSVVVLLNIPAVQAYLSATVANALGSTLQTEVHIGRIDWKVANRLVVDDIVLRDRNGEDLVKAARLSATFQILPLFRGKVVVDNIRLFSFSANLYKETAGGEPNYRFLVDKFSSDEPSESFIDLRINSILLRRGQLCHDLRYEPRDSSRFSPAHVRISDLNADLAIKALNTDSVNIAIKKFACKEQSGLHLKQLGARLTANRRQALLSRLSLELPGSQIRIDSLAATFERGASPSPFDIRRESLRFHGRVSPSVVSPADLACFLPALGRVDEAIHLSATLQGTGSGINIKHLVLRTQDEGIDVLLTTQITRDENRRDWNAKAQVYELTAQSPFLKKLATLANGKKTAAWPEGLTYISYHGTASYQHGESALDGILQCNAGGIKLSAALDGRRGFEANVLTKDFAAGTLLPGNTPLGNVSLEASVSGTWQDSVGALHSLQAQTTFKKIEFKGYAYTNLAADAQYKNGRWDGRIRWDDPNGMLTAELSLDRRSALPVVDVDARLADFAPHALHLTPRYGQTTFGGQLKAKLQGNSPENLAGDIALTDFCIRDTAETFLVDRTEVKSHSHGREHSLTLESDFATAEVKGNFDVRRLPETFSQLLRPYLPSIVPPADTHHAAKRPDDIYFTAVLQDSRLLQKLLGWPLTVEQPASLSGRIENSTGQLRLHGDMPELRYGDEHLKNITLACSNTSGSADSLSASLSADRMLKGHPIRVALRMSAADDLLRSALSWDNNKENVYRGTVGFDTQFYKDDKGEHALHMQFLPTELTLNDSIWHIHASTVDWQKGSVDIRNFLVNQGERHLSIDGRVSASPEDTLTAHLKDINLQYVFDIINFHAVEFGGHATGSVCANQLLESPQMDARLDVGHFTFNGGDMGDMKVHGWWNKNEKSIFLDAQMNDPAQASRTHVEGSITPGQGPGTGLDLNIATERINLFFLNEYTSGIFTDLQGRATGWARVFGPFKQIDLEGDLVIDEARMKVDVLNAWYTLEDDTVSLSPGNIDIRNAKVYDRHGGRGRADHYAIVNGRLRHNHFSNLTYNIDVRAHNILGYDQTEFGDEVFCGTAYATGLVSLNGRPGELNVDIQARPEAGTQFVYNASSPETVTDKEFIRFVSRTDSTRLARHDDAKAPGTDRPQDTDMESDMHINFHLDITPEATVKVLMDARAGDYIALNGYSNLRATYYNKGKFQMFGTFRVDHGTYKLSLQDVIRKDFQFRPGGTLVFGGEPYQADLNLQAIYTVPSVSLNDLSSGSTFSQNNVRVNCIMNLGGKARSPQVSFDFDLPNVNEDEKQMVRSLISTDEEKNMQIIYLLGIGRFYTYDYSNPDQSQSSVAMKSLLSSTLSGQLNQMLSTIVGNSNWNIGTNLSTGDTGWSDMDVEGLLSGRLLNNRLLINGNFGYRENTTTNSNFIGDFDLQWLLTRNGNISLKAYSETNERYFTKSTLTTQGIGLLLKKDFISWRDLFRRKKENKK